MKPQITFSWKDVACGSSRLQRSCGMKPQITQAIANEAPLRPRLQRSCGMKPQITSLDNARHDLR